MSLNWYFKEALGRQKPRNEEYDDMEAVLDLLMTIEAGNGNPAKVRFEEGTANPKRLRHPSHTVGKPLERWKWLYRLAGRRYHLYR